MHNGALAESGGRAGSTHPPPPPGSVRQRAQLGDVALQVEEATDGAALGPDLLDGGHDQARPDAAVLESAPAAVGQDPADAALLDRICQPGDADLALAAGEATDGGDVGARADQLPRGTGLAGHGERAPTVLLHVGKRLVQRLCVAAEHAA